MSVDYTGAPRDDLVREEDDQPMFAATPIYARSTKRRRPSGGDGFFDRTPTAALVGVPLGLVALGAAAYFTMAPRTGVEQLTPGAPTTIAEAPAASTAPMYPPVQSEASSQVLAAATPPAATEAATPRIIEPARAETRRSTPVRMARARPAPTTSDSALASGEDASATLPSGPQPYSSLTRAPGETPPAVNAPAPGAVVPPVNPAPIDPTSSRADQAQPATEAQATP